jgi:hypothetical protein
VNEVLNGASKLISAGRLGSVRSPVPGSMKFAARW